MNSLSESEKNSRRHVGITLLSYLLTFSFIITLATSGFILLSDYHRGVSEYETNGQQIQNSYQQSISYSLWNFDTRQIESQMAGILNFPGVVYVYIETDNDLIHSAGDVLSRTDQRHSFPLIFQNPGKEYNLGNLHIDINYADLYDELQEKAVQILLTQFVKTFSVSIFVLAIVRALITQRLRIMSNWASHFSLDNLESALVLNSRSGKQDELDLVAAAINKMRNTLKADIVEREKSKAQLEETKEQLSIAVDNAALGLCQYNSQTDKISCNHHFAQLLGSNQKELEASEHPMERFRELFHGEQNVELRERFNQLLFGRVNRMQTCIQVINLNHEEKFLDTTIQVISYHESRPLDILLCLVDKTKEQIATRKSQELAVNLENKVTKRTEELYEEQQRAKANIQKLTGQLERFQQSQINQLNTRFNILLLEYLKTKNHKMLDLLGQYLDLEINQPSRSLDLSSMITEWLQQHQQLHHVSINQDFPLTLILEENDKLIAFLLHCLILQEPLLDITDALALRLTLKGDHAYLAMKFTTSDSLKNEDGSLPEAWLLCDYIVSSQLQGELTRQIQANELLIDFSFSLNRSHDR